MTRRVIICVIAALLVGASTAGAATHYLITSTKQISPSVLKQLKSQG